jgi:hypothetical protein
MANQDSLAERSIRNAIDKDLEKQKFSLGLKKELFNEKGNIFSMRLAQYKDRDLAEQAARADMLLMADMQISKLEAKMADPAAKAKLQQIRGGLKLQYDQEMKKNAVELAKAQFERDKELAKLQFDLEGKQFDRQMQMREYYIPEFDSFATSKEGAKEIRNQVSTVKSAEDSINQLIKMTQAGMGKVAMRDLVAQAQVIKNMLTGELRLMIVGPGAVTEAEWKMLNDVVRDPTKMFSLDDSNKKALETLKERMYNKLKYKAKSEGITTDTWSTERAEADKTIKKLGTPNRAPNSVSRDPAMGAASPYAPAMTRSNQLMQEYDSKYGMQSAEAGRKQEPTYHETNRPNSELPQKKVSEMYARQPQSVAARDFNGPKQYGEGQLLRDDYKEQSDLAKQQAASSRFRKSKLLVDDKWLKKVHDISKKTDTKMPWLLNIIGLESGFNHKARNSKSSASGLFQLTETGARGIGKNLKDFRKMDQYEQLDVLEKYLNTHFAKMKKKDPKWKPTFSDVYAAILYPSKIGDSDSSTLFSKGSSAYKSNKGMDTNEDGKVTKGEAASKVKDYTGFDF